MIKKCYALVIVLICSPLISFAEDLSTDSLLRTQRGPYSIGVFGGYSIIWNTTTLSVLPEATDCGIFTNGKSNGIFAGLTFDYKLLPGFLHTSGRLLYSSRPATLETDNSPFEILDPSTNLYVPLVRHHVYSANLQYILLDLGLKFYPVSELPVYLRGGFDVGNPIIGKDFTQTEEIVSPNGVLFPDGKRKHTVAAGKIPGVSTAYGVLAGIGAEIEFQPDIYIYPEVSYRYGIGSILSSADWTVNCLMIGLGLQYEFGKELPAPPPPPPPPPPQPPPPPPVVVEVPKVTPPPPAVVIQSVSSVPLQVQETIVTQTFPLLPYIFFDSAKADISSKYLPKNANSSRFSETELPKETLPTYYTMLNLLGKRLSESQTTTITITGTTDGKELPTSQQRNALAKERAASIVQYLAKEWSIPKERFVIQTRDIPELPSNQKYKEGMEENRRAEISSENTTVLSPVVHSRFLEYAPVQNKQIFSVQTLHPELADSWNLVMSYKGTIINQTNGTGAPSASVPVELSTDETSKIGKEINQTDSLRGMLTIKQKDGTSVSAECYFPIIKSKNQFEVSRLSLIVFDFDRSDISDQNKDMMKKFVNEALQPSSVSTITGTTDRLGEADHNQILSEERAERVRDFLVTLKPTASIASVKGLGASLLQYDNKLPEGRYYCRTVSLEVKTPIKK